MIKYQVLRIDESDWDEDKDVNSYDEKDVTVMATYTHKESAEAWIDGRNDVSQHDADPFYFAIREKEVSE